MSSNVYSCQWPSRWGESGGGAEALENWRPEEILRKSNLVT